MLWLATPRLLELYKKYGIKTTWFTPGHTIDTFTDICKQIQADGHEFAHHGYYHENPTKIERETEQRLMELALRHVRPSARHPAGRLPLAVLGLL